MGLLDRALVVDNDELIKKTIYSLESSNNSLDFPSALFARLKEQLKIIKGALLLPEDDFVFVPWAETGFDRTTSRRIRIPQSIVNTIKQWNDFNYLELSDSEIEVMSDYFSFREFSVTESIIITPLLSNNKLIAILFISDGDILKKSDEEKLKVFKILSDKAGPLLFSKRESIVNKLETISKDEDNSEDALKRYINKNKGKEFILLSVQLVDFINSILIKDVNSISFRIKQDIMRLVKTLISDKGEVLDMGSSSILILLRGNRYEEAELFVHQIGLSLSFFYKINSNKFKPDYCIKQYPIDGTSTEELFKSLSLK